MANSIHINADRLIWCCTEMGTALAELADAVGVGKEKLERGELTYKQLARVAEHFGYTPLFFLEDGLPTRTVHSPAFRSIANQQAIPMTANLHKLIRRAEWHRDAYAHFLQELDLPAVFAPPPLSGAVADKAAQTREWLGLRDGAAYGFDDYRRLVEEKGILVIRSQGYKGRWNLNHPQVIGFSMPHAQVPLIFIKKSPPQRQAFTLFHELGHLLLHGKGSHIDSEESMQRGGGSNDKEAQANKFAGRCLVPDAALAAITAIPASAGDFDRAFLPAAKRLGVSVEVIVRALLERRRIGAQQYAQYRSLVQQRGGADEEKPQSDVRASRKYRHREPLHIFGRSYVQTVLEVLHDKKVTLSRACDYLDELNVPNVKALEGHLRNG